MSVMKLQLYLTLYLMYIHCSIRSGLTFKADQEYAENNVSSEHI